MGCYGGERIGIGGRYGHESTKAAQLETDCLWATKGRPRWGRQSSVGDEAAERVGGGEGYREKSEERRRSRIEVRLWRGSESGKARQGKARQGK